MKRVKAYILLLFIAFSTGAMGQIHDESKMQQINVMELGDGILTPSLYYGLLHKDYSLSANATNKFLFRTLETSFVTPQKEYSDSVARVMEKRAEIAAVEIADREVDIAWATEQKKIETQLEHMYSYIQRIVFFGGSTQEKSKWEEIYEMYPYAIEVIRSAYLPNAERKAAFVKLYADITMNNDLLKRELITLNALNQLKVFDEDNTVKKSDKKTAATNAYGRWKLAWTCGGIWTGQGGLGDLYTDNDSGLTSHTEGSGIGDTDRDAALNP